MNLLIKKSLKRYLKLLLFLTSPKKQKWFHDFNFDIMKPLPPSASSKLKIAIEELQNEIKHFRISDGTLLGIYRDGKLIAHDNDFDFDLEYSDDNLKKIKKLAHTQSWTLGRHVKYDGITQQLTYYDTEYVLFDFIFWRSDDLFSINFSEPNKFRIMPRDFLHNLKLEYFSEIGTQVNLPTNTVDWVVYRYGHSWNVPETSKGDWTETCGDLGHAWWIG